MDTHTHTHTHTRKHTYTAQTHTHTYTHIQGEGNVYIKILKNYHLQITRQCNGHLTEHTCNTIDVPVEVYYLNKIRTNSVKIFCIERCPETGWVGYREVLIWAETPVSRR